MIQMKRGSCLGRNGKYPHCGKENVPLISSRRHCIYCSNKWKFEQKKAKGERTQPKQESDRQKALNKVYNEVARQYKEDHPYCEIRKEGICTGRTSDVHHKAGRGKNLLNTKTFKASCRSCHTYIHENPKESREKGWLV